ncbi:MAG TPA: sigma 54-interacting transcriptional regulator [Syntrophomonadaceae bacterium]|nr:sigma 54-interacting transcriptional regulator [Syntrophomonadaceae bacterium]
MMLNRQVDLNQLLELLSGVLDEFGGLMVVDKKGCIIYTSAKFSEYFFGLGFWEARGQRVEDLLPDSGWDQVLANGLPCTGMVWNVNDQELLASWLPIIINGRLQAAVAVVGMLVFHNIEEFIALAREISGDRGKLDYYREEVKRLWGAKYSFDSIIGNSLAIVEAKRHAWDIAATRSPVLITGETGTGKELFAHAIHQDSPHREGPFIVLNCAGIPDSLVESELFGYEAGAFTGASRNGKPGKFELANNGSIFLDEISELPLNTQAKLLRVLQEREVQRIGGSSSLKINARVISATNMDIEEMVKKGLFREDLFYRINVFSVKVPALRERLEDIPVLSEDFIKGFNVEAGTRISGLSKEALCLMMKYEWPGNVRELKSTIERACLDARMGLIKPENLYYIRDRMKNKSANHESRTLTLKEAVMNTERQLIIETLQKTGGNKKKACELLDINRTSFYKRLKTLDIDY